MTGSMAFFWRDIQTIRGACRAAIALPHVDIGELREVERSGSYPVQPGVVSNNLARGVAQLHHEHGRITIRMARDRQTRAWQANPPSIAELFAIPIIAGVEV